MNRDLELLLAELKKLRANGPINPACGICGNIGSWMEERFTVPLRYVLYEDWPFYSGDVIFPIPSTNKKISCPVRYFREAKRLWRGRQRALRYSLINHMIAKIESGEVEL
jgi:hypothetical protein